MVARRPGPCLKGKPSCIGRRGLRPVANLRRQSVRRLNMISILLRHLWWRLSCLTFFADRKTTPKRPPVQRQHYTPLLRLCRLRGEALSGSLPSARGYLLFYGLPRLPKTKRPRSVALGALRSRCGPPTRVKVGKLSSLISRRSWPTTSRRSGSLVGTVPLPRRRHDVPCNSRRRTVSAASIQSAKFLNSLRHSITQRPTQRSDGAWSEQGCNGRWHKSPPFLAFSLWKQLGRMRNSVKMAVYCPPLCMSRIGVSVMLSMLMHFRVAATAT